MSDKKSTLDILKNPSVAEKSLVDYRLSICKDCEHKKIVIRAVEVCGKCNCPLISRTFFEKSFCVMGKW
jgi:hypothetical protein